MNQIFLGLGIESWKPVLSAIVISPLPLLLLVLVGARLMFRHRLLAWLLILLACVALWLSTTEAAGRTLTRLLLRPPPALSSGAIDDLRRAPDTAIVVLGGGRRLLAPEYGISSLKPRTIERLRYGIWLARATGLPLAFSGGIGWGAEPGPTEAEIAARVAEREFGYKLRWQEGESRDTRENAVKTIALLQPLGIRQIVLVTRDNHMRRALQNFEHATQGMGIRLVPAPMGLPASSALRGTDWLPSNEGYADTWTALHEWLGRVAGA
ncbi:MAG: YdcF family protein [Burkholderiales bacterium]|nr:YdcF family protein [Burkholderiales bacterium]